MRRLVCLLSIAALASCVGEITGSDPFEDADARVIVLEGAELLDELASSPVREADEPFVRIGVLWDADRPGAIEVSVSADGSEWSDWRAPTVHHIEVEDTASFVGQIEVIEGDALYLRLRKGAGAATFARLELFTTTLSEGIEDGDDAPGTLEARVIGDVEVNERSEWGARATHCSSSLGNAYRMAIHHTETPTNDTLSPQARLRQIQSYHMDVRGWCDIGYHYLVSRDGRLWEGRPGHLIGAHAGAGNNAGNIGISVMGSHDGTPITAQQLSNIAGLVRGLAYQHDIIIDRSHIKGHREYKSTSCPGDALFGQLDEIVATARDGGSSTESPPDMCTSDPLTTDGAWSCNGLTGTTTNAERVYYTTSFGCWTDEDGDPRGDAGDHCLPACSLSSLGCDHLTGPQCERATNWYTAGSDRFGCGTRLAVTNPDTNKTAVLEVIDRGPNCSIESAVDHWVLDMSYPASYYLFGEPTSASERADVVVELVPSNTPLGPYAGDVCELDQGGGAENPPGTVTVIGVLYRGTDTSDRIAGATVALGSSTVTTDAVGLWRFEGVPEGDYTVEASAPGYQTRSITRATYAAETWSSFGLSPEVAPTGSAVLQGVVYRTSNSSNRIPNATIVLSNGYMTTADGNGFYKLVDLPAGDVTIEASATSYPTASVTRALIDGETTWGSVRLE